MFLYTLMNPYTLEEYTGLHFQFFSLWYSYYFSIFMPIASS